MKKHVGRIAAIAAFAGTFINSSLNLMAAETEAASAIAARAKDPAWQPSAEEAGSIQVGNGGPAGTLRNFCLNADGTILACVAPNGGGQAIRVYSPAGKLLKTLPLEIAATTIATAPDGSIFVAGAGRLMKLDAAGKVLASAASPVAAVPVEITKDMEAMLKQRTGYTPAQLERTKDSLSKRRADVTGLAATGKDVFLAVPTPNEFSYCVYRFDDSLQNPKLVVGKLRGCCGQMDIQAHAGKLWIPHNGRHEVESRDRDGNEVSKFGKGGKVKPSDFGGCCEPKNMRVAANGDVLVAESGPPTCIKRFSTTGEFLGVIALLNEKTECVRVTVAVSPDGRSFYLMDTRRDAIRVFKTKS